MPTAHKVEVLPCYTVQDRIELRSLISPLRTGDATVNVLPHDLPSVAFGDCANSTGWMLWE